MTRRQRVLALEQLEPAEQLDGPFGGEDTADVRTRGDTPAPEEMVLLSEDVRQFYDLLRQVLSDLEWQALSGRLAGKSYHEIAAELGCTAKSVDNALSRINRKVRGASVADEADLSGLL